MSRLPSVTRVFRGLTPTEIMKPPPAPADRAATARRLLSSWPKGGAGAIAIGISRARRREDREQGPEAAPRSPAIGRMLVGMRILGQRPARRMCEQLLAAIALAVEVAIGVGDPPGAVALDHRGEAEEGCAWAFADADRLSGIGTGSSGGADRREGARASAGSSRGLPPRAPASTAAPRLAGKEAVAAGLRLQRAVGVHPVESMAGRGRLDAATTADGRVLPARARGEPELEQPGMAIGERLDPDLRAEAGGGRAAERLAMPAGRPGRGSGQPISRRVARAARDRATGEGPRAGARSSVGRSASRGEKGVAGHPHRLALGRGRRMLRQRQYPRPDCGGGAGGARPDKSAPRWRRSRWRSGVCS